VPGVGPGECGRGDAVKRRGTGGGDVMKRRKAKDARRNGSGRRLEVSAELVAPAPCCNEPDPVCEGMSAVVAELLESSGMTSYRIAKITGLSREEICKLRRRHGGIGMKSAVTIGRAFFFSYTELAALAEEWARRRHPY
jgi:hypothetical protein